MKSKLGKLERIRDLRSVWKHEASGFSTWLSKPNNLELLGEEIGLNIELIRTEAESGSFSVDILAEESETGKKVIIENQLERTDHDHLGKIITYASGYEAEYIIWIVKEFRNEHKSALDWLNEHTDEKINFFGITIELWRIGESPVAPKFNIISQPNSWSKTIKSNSRKGQLSETGLKQMSFIEEFISYAQSNNTSLRLSNPQPSTPSYYGFGINVSGVTVVVRPSKNKKILKIDYYFAETDLFKLLRQEVEVETKIKFPNLIWDEMPGKKGANVGLELKGFDLNNVKNWEVYHEWLLKNLEDLTAYFYPRLVSLRNGE